MTIQKKILISLLSLLLFIPFVANASSVVDYLASSYGYTYTDTGGTTHSYTWSGYNTNYVQRSLSDFPSTYNDEGLKIKDFGIRFRIDGGFKKDHNYIITLQWENYSSDYPSLPNYNWYDVYRTMPKTWTCRIDSWSGTSQSESTCFYSDSHSEPSKVSQSTTLINFYVNPKIDMYGFTIYWENSNYYYSEGWSLIASYTEVTDESQAIIDNATQNAQNIINNQNTNTQTIINNQNTNTQAIIDSNKSCDFIDKNSIETDNAYLNSYGGINSNTGYGITGYYSVIGSDFIVNEVFNGANYCTYTATRIVLNCYANTSMTAGQKLNFAENVKYVRFSISKSQNKPQIKKCTNGSQAVTDTITDDNVDGANSDASNFFSGFTTNTYGLTSIITAPLTLIQSLTSTTCSDLVLPIPFVNQNLTLPCMYTIYSQNFGSFLTLYQTITYGIVAYWVIVRIFNLVKDFKNPDHDEIEVMEL